MGDQVSEVENLERIFADATADPIQISYTAIKHITKNFSLAIGQGGFGVVYLVCLVLDCLKNGNFICSQLKQSIHVNANMESDTGRSSRWAGCCGEAFHNE